MFGFVRSVACYVAKTAAWYLAAAILGMLIYGGLLLAGVWLVDEKLTK